MLSNRVQQGRAGCPALRSHRSRHALWCSNTCMLANGGGLVLENRDMQRIGSAEPTRNMSGRRAIAPPLLRTRRNSTLNRRSGIIGRAVSR
jgi:hypothetical protein